MLSIGKLSADQASYYLDQAEQRVDVVASVGDGIEDYYLGPQEARGEWLGAAAQELGLAGPVEPDALRAVLAGLDPCTGAPLRASTSRARVAGFDLTFSAPKSVSVLYGLGDDELRGRVRTAHDVAARQAIGYLERSAAAVRRGHGGAVVEQASGVVAAAFRHRTSRAGDPQLHTHVLVANLGRGLDGRWSALDGRRLYAHSRAASFLYQAVLRGELTREIGVEWAPVRRGIAEVIGVPRAVTREFSKRRAEIDAALVARGTEGPRAAEAAALATRRTKGPAVADVELVATWRRRAQGLGFGTPEIAVIVGRARSCQLDGEAVEQAFDHLAGPRGLTERLATFGRSDVIQGLCEALPVGTELAAEWLERAADRFLSERAVPLIPGPDARETGKAFRRRDGRVMPAGTEQLRYSTPEHLALERRCVARAVSAAQAGIGQANPAAAAAALAARPTLSLEQRRVVEALCLDGHGVAVVAGRAGTGKTFALGAAREAWQTSGYAVLGVAIARRAAGELQEGAGIASTSVAALLGDLAGSEAGLPSRCVLVVDEAGMVPTRDLAKLLDHIERARGKLVLVGDDRQLPELAAGGAFRGLVQRGLAVELHVNVRQVNGWERRALDQLRAGQAEEALAAYRGHGALDVAPTTRDARKQLVADWLAAGDLDQAVMIAQRRIDVTDLNQRAREQLRASGRLGGLELELPGGRFAVGDRVVIKRNDLPLGVHNGQRGWVVGIDLGAGSLTIAGHGRAWALDAAFLRGATQAGDPTLVHGYAITGHVAQGLTVDRSFVLAAEGMSREWAYVALSRGRLSNRLYLAERCDDERAEFAPVEYDQGDPVARLGTALQRSDAQVLAIDTGRDPRELTEASHAVKAATWQREGLERRRFNWLPGRRRALESARERERVAGAAYASTKRAAAEQVHAARPFVSERDVQVADARQYERSLELKNQRVLLRARRRDFGREL